MIMELAHWIFYEEEYFYCSSCIEKRLEEINSNREFAEYIDYENGDTCGFYQDYAPQRDNEDPFQEICCSCSKPLLTLGID